MPVMIRFLPLFVGIVPVIGVAASFSLNVRAEVLDGCMPLLEGCVSISATGRYMPGSMPFRAVLLPQAALLVVLWWVGVEWLRQVAPSSRAGRTVLSSGVVGAVALVAYVTFLGTRQPFYEFMRHFGIYFYFFGTAIAQIALTVAMPHSRLRSIMFWVIVAPFVLGLINWAQKLLLGNSSIFENTIEWNSALLMQVWFVLLYFAWRKTGIVISVRTDPPSVRR
jgi:hypothetical protein